MTDDRSNMDPDQDGNWELHEEIDHYLNNLSTDEPSTEAGEEKQEMVDDDFANLSPQEQLNVLRQDLEEMRRETAQCREVTQRAQADLANFRKRVEEERSEIQQNANRRLIVSLLTVIDELELAINHSDDAAAGSWVEGVKLIHRKAYGILESEGLSKIETVGVLFDPLEHEAVGLVESSEIPSGYVVEQIRNGYRLGDRVIQAAQVVVAK